MILQITAKPHQLFFFIYLFLYIKTNDLIFTSHRMWKMVYSFTSTLTLRHYYCICQWHLEQLAF